MAATIQPQLGASQIMKGMGMAKSHPHSRTRLRPTRSDNRPATKLSTPFTAPKATTNAESNMNEPCATPNSSSASAGTTVRIMPMAKTHQENLDQLMDELPPVFFDAVGQVAEVVARKFALLRAHVSVTFDSRCYPWQA